MIHRLFARRTGLSALRFSLANKLTQTGRNVAQRRRDVSSRARTVSFSHANLTYESSWLCFNAAPPLPPRLPHPPLPAPPLPLCLATVSPSMSRMDAADSRSLIAASCLALHGHLATARFHRQLVILRPHPSSPAVRRGLRAKAESRRECQCELVGRPGPQQFSKCRRHCEASIFLPR